VQQHPPRIQAVTVNHVDTALKIWGKNVMALLERKDHSDDTRSGGKGLCEGSSGAIETPQRGVCHCQPFLCEQNSILPHVESQDMLYGNQSPHRQKCSANIHGVQGNLPVLSPKLAFALQW
jgi:hypothetical protein